MTVADAALASSGGLATRRMLNGLAFYAGIELSYNVYGGTNSSPQTTDVFGGGERSATLMKWVSIAGVKCILYAILGSTIMHSWWPAAGVALSAGSMHGLYVHANRSALRREAAGVGSPIPNGGPTAPARWRFQKAPTG